MAMVVKTNIDAQKGLNTLNKNSKALAKSLKKVSSGMKINSASDDASGYAISEGMRVQLRALTQANSNTQNANSLLKVADGAMSNTVDILRTMREKADRKQMVKFTPNAEVMGEVDYKLNLLGLHQANNSALAAATAMILAVDELSITKASIRHAMKKVEWAGRFELMANAKEKYGHQVLIDGAHNPAGITTLRESLDFYFPQEKRVFVLGILKDKDFANMLKILLRKEDKVVFTTPSSERAANPVDLLEYADVEVKEAIGDPVEALKRGHELTNNDELLICAGSLYLIGYLREQLL